MFAPVIDVPEDGPSLAFNAAVTAAWISLLIWFLFKRRFREIFLVVLPLAFVQCAHQEIYPASTGSWWYSLMVCAGGLASVLVANALWWLALRLLRAGGSVPYTLRQRLWVLGYYCFTVFLGYSYTFQMLGLKETDGSVTHNIFTAMYFTAMTWTTVGYGDVVPHDGWSRFMAAVAALNGYAVLAVLIATLLPIFTDSKRARSEGIEN